MIKAGKIRTFVYFRISRILTAPKPIQTDRIASMEESIESQRLGEMPLPHSSHTLTTGRKSKPRKLLSVNSVSNPGSKSLFSKETLKVPGSKQDQPGSATLLASQRGFTAHKSVGKGPAMDMLSSKPIMYKEKAQPRNDLPRVTQYKDRPSKAKMDDNDSRDTDQDSSDDSLSDFIVSDSASESELRRPPPSMRKKNTNTPTGRTPRNRRNIILDDEDIEEAPAAVGLGSISLPNALNALSLNPASIADSIPQRDGLPRQDADDEPISIRKRETKSKGTILSCRTPPTSPSKPKLQSPTKSRLQIPQSPHGPSIDAFWTQDVINDWNDVYSPQKTQKIKKFFDLKNDDADLSPSESPSRKENRSPAKKNKTELEKKRLFESRKHSLAADFLDELDQSVTNGQLAVLSKSTGGVQISWSKTLNSTAGRANWQREAIRAKETTSKSSSTATMYKHKASIELAEKVIDDEDRLLNVLAHEFCHLANFMISNVKDQPHGRSFKEWAHKVTTKFPHKNIHVTTKHSYAIDYKYIWGCVDCGIEYKRHSKSVDPGRHGCGACKGKIVQIKPIPRGTARSGSSAATAVKSNPYQVFVKQWYAVVKKEHADWKMKDIMSELSRRYKAEKECIKRGTGGPNKQQKIPISAKEGIEAIIVISDNDSTSSENDLQALDKKLTALALD